MRVPSAVLVLVLVLVAGGCGSGDDQPTAPETTSSPASRAAPSTGTVAIEDFKFVPEDLTVDVGTSVTWTNADSAPHTATADDGSFDTGTLRDGGAGKVTFREVGSFAYFCEFHKFMRAKVTVR